MSLGYEATRTDTPFRSGRSVAPGTRWESRTGEVRATVFRSNSVSVTFTMTGRPLDLVTWRIDHFTEAFHPCDAD